MKNIKNNPKTKTPKEPAVFRPQDKNSKPDILDHIECILEIVKRDGIEDPGGKLSRHANFVSKKLRISPVQAVLFSLFMERNTDNCITLQDIASSMNCNNIKILKYDNDIEALEKKKLIRCSRNSNSLTYRVPFEVCESLRKNNGYKAPKKNNLSIETFFSALAEIFEERQNNEYTFETMTFALQDLIDQNKHLQFCKRIMRYNLNENDLAFLILVCHLAGNNDDDNIGYHDYSFMYEDKSDAKSVKKKIGKGDHILFGKKLIEHNNSNGFFEADSIKMTDSGKKELLSELGITNTNIDTTRDLFVYDKIKPRKLFYNSKESEDIKALIDLLQEENYRKILARLDKKGMRQGFACLFSGPPGTGKTETAYQIARETKRHLMMVDISEVKSCWYGESEKRVKKIFDTYREIVENSKIAPILLFNEADAVIGKRKEFNAGSRAVDQTENTIQNIILQEMENLRGILIATTNLTTNLDPAFERRFLYKITFNKPSFESRIGIWKSMMPGLSQDNAKELSRRFELSGGQIENITRKIEVSYILKGEEAAMDNLIALCNDELSGGFTNDKKIGFI